MWVRNLSQKNIYIVQVYHNIYIYICNRMQAVSFYSAEMPITEKNIVNKRAKIKSNIFHPCKMFLKILPNDDNISLYSANH